MNEHFAIVTHEVDPYTESKSRKRGIQMSETEPVVPSTLTPSLRREALLPNERNRGLGTVAVVCTMAGVASGLALATTLMAMQVADSMAPRQCPYHLQHVQAFSETRYDHGFLGIRYFFKDGVAEIDSVLPNTPAERIRLHKGDHVIRVNGAPIGSSADLQERIFNSRPGTTPTLVVERDGTQHTYHPVLIQWPSSIVY